MLREMPDVETSSVEYANRFSGPAGAYFLAAQKAAVLKVLKVPFGKTVLDVGGGHGQLVPYLSDSGYEVTVFGSSCVCHSRLIASRYNASLSYVTGDLLNLPFADQSYDLVIAVRLISHIQAWQRLLAEFCRVARNTVVIDYPNVISINALTPLFFKLKKHIEKNTRTYASFSSRQIGRELARHGFRLADADAQFFMPMVIHRALGGARYLQAGEEVFRVLRLTQLFGSPVVLRADKK